jgi:hypothetical protein
VESRGRGRELHIAGRSILLSIKTFMALAAGDMAGGNSMFHPFAHHFTPILRQPPSCPSSSRHQMSFMCSSRRPARRNRRRYPSKNATERARICRHHRQRDAGRRWCYGVRSQRGVSVQLDTARRPTHIARATTNSEGIGRNQSTRTKR